mgnify:CR=1 FL=1
MLLIVIFLMCLHLLRILRTYKHVKKELIIIKLQSSTIFSQGNTHLLSLC